MFTRRLKKQGYYNKLLSHFLRILSRLTFYSSITIHSGLSNSACNSESSSSILFRPLLLVACCESCCDDITLGGRYKCNANELATTLRDERAIAKAATVGGSLVWNTG